MDPNWVSALVALLAFLFAVVAHMSVARAQIRTDALEKKSTELAEKQNRLAHQSWSDAYFNEITAWAMEVSAAISQAIHIVGDTNSALRQSTLITLSASIDTGRWYFPNRKHMERGVHKEPAYRGVRQPVLDWVVFAYDVCSDESRYSNARGELVTCQRNFVSFIQEILDPRTRAQSIEQVLADFGPVADLPKVQSPQ